MNQLAEDCPLRTHSLDRFRGWAAFFVLFYHSIRHNDLSLIGRVLDQPTQSLMGWTTCWRISFPIFHYSISNPK